MKKIIILVIVLSLLLTGCISKATESTQLRKQADEKSTDPRESIAKVESLEAGLNNITVNNLEPNVKEINFNLPEKYSVAFADRIGSDLIVSIMNFRDAIDSEGNENYVTHLTLIKYNLYSREHEVIYQGDTYTDSFNTRLKVLQNGNIAFYASTKVLLLDKENLRVISEVDLPEHSYFNYDISPDGTKIVMDQFSEVGNLSITDWEFFEWKTLVKGVKGSDPHGMDSKGPGYPHWSNDGSQISYIMFLYESSEGVGVVDVEGKNNNLFIKDDPQFIPAYAYWLNDDKHIIAGQYLGEPKAYLINVSNGNFRELELSGAFQNITLNPVEPKAVYINQDDNLIYMIDFKTNKNKPVTPAQDYVSGLEWDDTGNELIAVRSNRIRIITLED